MGNGEIDGVNENFKWNEINSPNVLFLEVFISIPNISSVFSSFTSTFRHHQLSNFKLTNDGDSMKQH